MNATLDLGRLEAGRETMRTSRRSTWTVSSREIEAAGATVLVPASVSLRWGTGSERGR